MGNGGLMERYPAQATCGPASMCAGGSYSGSSCSGSECRTRCTITDALSSCHKTPRPQRYEYPGSTESSPRSLNVDVGEPEPISARLVPTFPQAYSSNVSSREAGEVSGAQAERQAQSLVQSFFQ